MSRCCTRSFSRHIQTPPLCRRSGLAAQTLHKARTFSSSCISTLKMLGFVNAILFMSFKENVWPSTTRKASAGFTLFSDKEFSSFSKSFGDSLLPIILKNSHDYQQADAQVFVGPPSPGHSLKEIAPEVCGRIFSMVENLKQGQHLLFCVSQS